MSRTPKEKLAALRKVLDSVEDKYGLSSWCFVGASEDGQRVIVGIDADFPTIEAAQGLMMKGLVDLTRWKEVPRSGEILEID